MILAWLGDELPCDMLVHGTCTNSQSNTGTDNTGQDRRQNAEKPSATLDP